jgi:ubiquinone/menaquinone biosynthesis C-methylase UbiE
LRQGDFTYLAQDYVHRTGYSLSVLGAMLVHTGLDTPAAVIVDVGAGTGKLAEGPIALGLSGFAVEPNDAMQQIGRACAGDSPFEWRRGRTEALDLPDCSADGILIGSAFQWTEAVKAVTECHHVLRPGGYFSALQRFEDLILSSGEFEEVIPIEASPSRDVRRRALWGVRPSVNDTEAQVGHEYFAAIIRMKMIATKSPASISYRSPIVREPGRLEPSSIAS